MNGEVIKVAKRLEQAIIKRKGFTKFEGAEAAAVLLSAFNANEITQSEFDAVNAAVKRITR